MLLHAGALRPTISCSRRLASRYRPVCYPPLKLGVGASRSKDSPELPVRGLLFCHLHHDARRRRDGSRGAAMPPIPRALRLSRLGRNDGAWENSVLAATMGAQRVTFSAGDPTSSSGSKRRSGGKEQSPTSGMDEETRKSIGESDEKAKKSMQTVKVRRGPCFVLSLSRAAGRSTRRFEGRGC